MNSSDPSEQQQLKIASLVCMTLFAFSMVFSFFGFILTRRITSKTFLRVFFVETLLISLF